MNGPKMTHDRIAIRWVGIAIILSLVYALALYSLAPSMSGLFIAAWTLVLLGLMARILKQLDYPLRRLPSRSGISLLRTSVLSRMDHLSTEFAWLSMILIMLGISFLIARPSVRFDSSAISPEQSATSVSVGPITTVLSPTVTVQFGSIYLPLMKTEPKPIAPINALIPTPTPTFIVIAARLPTYPTPQPTTTLDSQRATIGYLTESALLLTSQVEIAEIHHAAASDPKNINSEYITLVNFGDSVEMSKWTLISDYGDVFRFGDFVFGANSVIRIHSGRGQSTNTDLFWNMSNPIWADRSVVTLLDSDGNIVDQYLHQVPD